MLLIIKNQVYFQRVAPEAPLVLPLTRHFHINKEAKYGVACHIQLLQKPPHLSQITKKI